MMTWGADIQLYFYGVWRLMMGKPDGMRLLDVSADGFWNSFFAILVALPALLMGWLVFANEAESLMLLPSLPRYQVVIRLMIVDIGAWILSLVALAAVASQVKIGDRFVHYVVATNWSSALLAWMVLPPTLLQTLFPALAEISILLSLMFFFVALFLSWRVTVAAIGKGPAVGTSVFVAMFVVSAAILFALGRLLGTHTNGL